jgi:hypothetical protein
VDRVDIDWTVPRTCNWERRDSGYTLRGVKKVRIHCIFTVYPVSVRLYVHCLSTVHSLSAIAYPRPKDSTVYLLCIRCQCLSASHEFTAYFTSGLILVYSWLCTVLLLFIYCVSSLSVRAEDREQID